MVLDATLSVGQVAQLLDTSIADVRARIRAGELACFEFGGTRIGWRSVASTLGRELTDHPDRLRASLEGLLAIRAGSLLVDGSTPEVEQSSQPHEVGSTPARPVASRVLERLGLLREAARAVGGGERLSCGAFDNWSARHGLSLTAAALFGEYGSWNAAKRQAGLSVRERPMRRAATNDELVELLRAAALECGDVRLTMAAFNSYCEAFAIDADAALATSRFGSWNRAKAAAGLALRHPGYQRAIGREDPYRDLNRPAEP